MIFWCYLTVKPSFSISNLIKFVYYAIISCRPLRYQAMNMNLQRRTFYMLKESHRTTVLPSWNSHLMIEVPCRRYTMKTLTVHLPWPSKIFILFASSLPSLPLKVMFCHLSGNFPLPQVPTNSHKFKGIAWWLQMAGNVWRCEGNYLLCSLKRLRPDLGSWYRSPL